MSKQILVNFSHYETRVATLENGEIRSLHIEREEDKNVVGNIYLGVVKRVLPGMQAAFLELGLERTAFLYVDDIIDQPFGGDVDLLDETESGEEGETPFELGAEDDGEPLKESYDEEVAEGGERQSWERDVAVAPSSDQTPQVEARTAQVNPETSEETEEFFEKSPEERAEELIESDEAEEEEELFESEDVDDEEGDSESEEEDDFESEEEFEDSDEQLEEVESKEFKEESAQENVEVERVEVAQELAPHESEEVVKETASEPVQVQVSETPRTDSNPESEEDNIGNRIDRHRTNRPGRDNRRGQGRNWGRRPSGHRDRARGNRDSYGMRDRQSRDRGYRDYNREDEYRSPSDQERIDRERYERESGYRPQPSQDYDRDADRSSGYRGRDRDRDRDWERGRDRDRGQERDRDRGQDRDRDRGQDRDRDRGQDRDRDRGQERDRDRGQDRDRDRGQDRDRDRGQDRDRDRGQDRDRDRGQDRDRDRGPDRDRGRERDNRDRDRNSRDRNRQGRGQHRDSRERNDRDRGRDRNEGGRRSPRRPHHHGGRSRNGRRFQKRRSRGSANIQDLLKEGQEILVQVAKAPIGTKGARLTTHISLPGRNLVLMPTVKHLGISRRIESDRERRRLRDIFTKRLRPKDAGFIIRTVAEGKSFRDLKADAEYLLKTWARIKRDSKKKRAPALIHEDLSLSMRAVRDFFNEEVDSFVIDNAEEHENILQFIDQFMPQLKSAVKLFKGPSQLFEHYGIEAEISRALNKKVWLKSGGYLLFDQSEALTAIDVNTGRYVGSKSLEETILKTNLEAVKEIAYQLRIRNVGGIIILDLIDMESGENREKVYQALQEALSEDKSRTNILKISELGLVEMTRKRTHEDLIRYLTEACTVCEGRGYHKSRRTVCFEIFREIEKEALSNTKNIVVFAAPAVVSRMMNEEKKHVAQLEDRFGKTILVKPDPAFHIEQYEVFGKH